MLKFIFTLMFCICSFASNAFIIDNKTGKKLAVFFCKSFKQILPSQYYVYYQGSFDPRRKDPIEILEEPEVILIGPGKTELKFKENTNEFSIIDHDLTIKYKIGINSGNWGNVYCNRESGIAMVKSTSIFYGSDFEKLKSDSTILEVVPGKEKNKNDVYEIEVLNYSFRTIEDEQPSFSKFLHEVVKLCAIL